MNQKKKLILILFYSIVISCLGQPYVTGVGVYDNEINYGSGYHSGNNGTTISEYRSRSCGYREYFYFPSDTNEFNRYIYDFGDGNIYEDKLSSTGSLITHSYEKPGIYTYSFKILGINGNVTYERPPKISPDGISPPVIRPGSNLMAVGGTPPTLIPNQTLYQCDNNNDGIGNFNLKEIYNKIIDKNVSNFYGDEFYDIFFYESIEAIQNYDSIPTLMPYQNKTSNPKELFAVVHIKVEDYVFRCFSVMNFFVSASNITLGPIDFMMTCDASNGVDDDKIGTFNLEIKENDIRNQFALPLNTSIKFYPTELDAEFGSKLITESQYVNYNSRSKTIWVRAEDENLECIGIEPISLIVNTFPQSNLSNEYIVCLNKFPKNTLQIDAGLNYEGYEWKDKNNITFSTDSSVTISELGNYTLTTYLTQNGMLCTKTEEFAVTPSNVATMESIKVAEGLENNNSISVIASGEGTYEYQLIDSTTNLIYRPYQSSNMFENVNPGFYNVYVKDIKNNCGIVNDKVSVIGFPKFFTPNNDGYNDTWQVYGVSSMFHPNAKIQIFNRYGKLLKELSAIGNGWDGSVNGEKLTSDDYWFSVTFEDGRVFNGHFTLKH